MADIFGLRGDRYAFLRLAPPPSYVAGAGRGAQGFTTRSDIGPAREQVQEGEDAAPKEEEYNPDQFQDPENETGLFAGESLPWPFAKYETSNGTKNRQARSTRRTTKRPTGSTRPSMPRLTSGGAPGGRHARRKRQRSSSPSGRRSRASSPT